MMPRSPVLSISHYAYLCEMTGQKSLTAKQVDLILDLIKQHLLPAAKVSSTVKETAQ